MNQNVIRVENLVKYFDGRCVLDGINLNVPQGCIYGLLGRNGAIAPCNGVVHSDLLDGYFRSDPLDVNAPAFVIVTWPRHALSN